MFTFENEKCSCFYLTNKGAVYENTTGTQGQNSTENAKSKPQILPKKAMVTSTSLLIDNQTFS